MRRATLISVIAARILAAPNPRILFVAVDGVDGAGKTFFANELGKTLGESTPVIRASVDSFHNPKAVRYRRGRSSPDGFFRDSYDYAMLRQCLLDPLSKDGNLKFRRAAFDLDSDQPLVAMPETATPGSILLFDGIFLHRPELRQYWNFSVFLDVPFAISIPRAAQRGGMADNPEDAGNRRYVIGQSIYLAECEPRLRATVVVNNEDLEAPYIVS